MAFLVQKWKEKRASLCLDGKLNHSIVDGVVSTSFYCLRFFSCTLRFLLLQSMTAARYTPCCKVPSFSPSKTSKRGGLSHNETKFWSFPVNLVGFLPCCCTNIWRMQSFLNTLAHIVWKWLKMSHSKFVLILVFSTNICPIKTELSGNTVWPQASGFQKLAKMDHFWHF